jgi:hypothetical protein
MTDDDSGMIPERFMKLASCGKFISGGESSFFDGLVSVAGRGADETFGPGVEAAY